MAVPVVDAAPATPQASTPSAAPLPVPVAVDVSANNGYTLTVQYWLTLEQTARETEKVLQELYTQTAAAIPDDPSRMRKYFAEKLSEKFPGSSFNGIMGTVVLPNKMLAHFNDKFTVDRFEEVGRISVNYFLKQGQFVCSNGTNSVGGIINKANPSQSVFTKVDINDMKKEAEKVLGNRTVEANSPEEAVINDAYQLLAVTNNARMDTYAGQLVVSTEAQQYALGLAEKGYKQRHQGEYQAGAAGEKKPRTASKDLELPSEQNSSTKLMLRFAVIIGLFLLCALFVKLSWHFLRAGFKSLKRNSNKKRRSSRFSTGSRSSSGSRGSSEQHSSSSSSSSSGSSRTHRSSRSHRPRS
jgi:hypothetical protein